MSVLAPSSAGPASAPFALDDIPEPRVVALLTGTRAGSKLFQSFLDDHPDIIMIPGYPLMYLYPHWDYWQETEGPGLGWGRLIDLFCEKHGSVIDSRRVAGLSGLERLGDTHSTHIQIDEQDFRAVLAGLLAGKAICRRTFFLALHFAYAHCKGWDVRQRRTLVFHVHHADFMPGLHADFPNLQAVIMTRMPVAALHSQDRVMGIVDEQKLNATDAMLWQRRVYWLTCGLEFEAINSMAAFMDPQAARIVRLEDIHGDLRGVMKALAAWIGIGFNEGMLVSTFDGHKYWGDVSNKEPVNGVDPHAVSQKWRVSLSTIDQFVAEGLSWNRYRSYDYTPEFYRKDGLVQRVLLALAILVPTRIEVRQVKARLSFESFAAFMRAARAEAEGSLPRKNYKWNGTYLFKFAYKDLKLWQPRLQDRILALPVPPDVRRTLYLGFQALRYSILPVMFTVSYARRIAVFYRQLRRRLEGKEFLPPVLR